MNKQGNHLQALAGYALDVVRLARSDAVNPHSLTKFQTLRAMQRRTGATTFVETGTYLGVTTKRCAPYFERVYTIELDEQLARQATEWLRPYPNVNVIQGDAELEIRKVFENGLVDNAIVFLDGHFSGGVTATTEHPEPALTIMDFLAAHAERMVGIVVDDFREFGTQAGWPKKWELVKIAEERFATRGFRLSVHFDQLLLERSRG